MLTYTEILKAKKRIEGYIYETPLEKSIYLSDETKNYYLKLESLQTPKSFKIRGALSRMTLLSEAEKEKGVVAVSSGNHGAAVSYGASILGIEKVLIFVPKCTPKSKIEKIRYYGGNVRIVGDNYDQAHKIGMEFINEYNMTLIDPYYEDSVVYAGQGTVGLEILRQNPNIDTILVPIGGGGLITGISIAAKTINPNIRIIGVQPELCPAMKRSMDEEIFYEEFESLGDSTCEALVGGIGKLAYELSKDCIDDVISVSEEYIRKGIRHCAIKEKVIAEPSSAICVGALLEHGHRISGENVACVISGGNISNELLIDVLTS